MEPAPTVLHGLNRDPNHTDIRLRKAAKDLETSFLAEMLKSAKILKMPDGLAAVPAKHIFNLIWCRAWPKRSAHKAGLAWPMWYIPRLKSAP